MRRLRRLKENDRISALDWNEMCDRVEHAERISVGPGLQLSNGHSGPTLAVDVSPFESWPFAETMVAISGTPYVNNYNKWPNGELQSAGLVRIFTPTLIDEDTVEMRAVTTLTAYNLTPFNFPLNYPVKAFKFNDVWCIAPIRRPVFRATSWATASLGLMSWEWFSGGVNEGEIFMEPVGTGGTTFETFKVIAEISTMPVRIHFEIELGVDYGVDAIREDIQLGWNFNGGDFFPLRRQCHDWRLLGNDGNAAKTDDAGTGPHSHGLSTVGLAPLGTEFLSGGMQVNTVHFGGDVVLSLSKGDTIEFNLSSTQPVDGISSSGHNHVFFEPLFAGATPF